MEQKKYTTWEITKRLFAPAFSGGKGYWRIIISLFASAGMGTIYAWAIKLITNALLKSNISLLRNMIIILGVGYVILLGANRAWDKRYRISSTRTSLYLNMQYLKKYLLLDNNYVEGQGLGRMQSIIFTGTNQWSNILSNLISSSRIVIMLITSFVLLATSSSYAAFYLVFIIAMTFVLAFIYFPFQRERRKKRAENRTEVSKYNIRFLMSKLDILQNDKFLLEGARFQQLQEKDEYITTKMFKYFFYMVDIPGFLVDILRFGIPLLAIYVIKGYVNLSIGDLALMLGMVAVIDNIVSSVSQTYRNTVENYTDVEKLWDMFDNAPQIRGYENGKNITIGTGNIALQNITYNYGKGEVLKNFSLQIEGGKKTAFVGISGSGKSTLIKLIAGYIHPQKGEVLIDGQALPNETNKKYVSLKSYYKHIGYLTQEPNVFDGTIYENLTYALDHEPSQEEVQAAIYGAQCQFIYEFPDGVQTEIGEKGIKLSGGQRQRLAIAKVMLKNPQIILLDEPTSALDSFSEEEVTKAFNNLFEGRTVIVIAHRLQTVKKADRIIVLDHGKVVEEGNHDSLVKSGGVYAKMLELQSGF